MSSCINNNNNNNGNDDTRQDGDLLHAVERYFDGDGKLLPVHYPEVYGQIAEAAKRYGKDLSFLNRKNALGERMSNAKVNGWSIGASYNRCSTDMQDSYIAQIRRCIDRAIQNDILILPEYIAGDEGKTGKAGNRIGLSTLKGWIFDRDVSAIIAFSASRWFRSLHKGLQFIQEDVVEHGVRAITIAENVDTNDKQWNDILTLNLFLAQKQVSAHPEFVRMGQRRLIENGLLVGSCFLGYRPEPIPEAGVTKRGKMRTRPAIVPEVADLIVKHFELISGGMTISAGCRLWNRDIEVWPSDLKKWAMDPRCRKGRMTSHAYRNMLRQKKYIGIWEYGRTRNKWLDSRNITIQVEGPRNEVVSSVREELRIVSDELFYRVQAKLDGGKRGKHGPRTGKEPPLSTLLLNLFRCSECGHVFHSYGKQYIHCPNSTTVVCKNWGTVNREGAIKAIIAALREQVLGNRELVGEIVRQSIEMEAEENTGNLAEQISTLQKAIKRQGNIMSQIEESCSDVGMDADDQNRHKTAKIEKARLFSELKSMEARHAKRHQAISEEEVMAILTDFDTLLADADAGLLGADGKQRAATLIRELAGGVIRVSFTQLQGRRRFGIGHFKPNPILAISGLSDTDRKTSLGLPEIRVDFRQLPRYARIADEVHRLHIEEGLTLTEIGKRFACGCGNAWGALAYWHSSRRLPIPYKRANIQKKQEQSRHIETRANSGFPTP